MGKEQIGCCFEHTECVSLDHKGVDSLYEELIFPGTCRGYRAPLQVPVGLPWRRPATGS